MYAFEHLDLPEYHFSNNQLPINKIGMVIRNNKMSSYNFYTQVKHNLICRLVYSIPGPAKEF